ncbi:MAG: hypothetical protein KBT03_06870 [Bacteroidales bacterium]|nr:hypothetical protein [Candidatus Scybalousia scybalohippi]
MLNLDTLKLIKELETAKGEQRGMIHDALSKVNVGKGEKYPITEDLTREDAVGGYPYYESAIRNNVKADLFANSKLYDALRKRK